MTITGRLVCGFFALVLLMIPIGIGLELAGLDGAVEVLSGIATSVAVGVALGGAIVLGWMAVMPGKGGL